MAATRTYDPNNGWLEDLRIEVKERRRTVTTAARELGMSRATAYRIIADARENGHW